MNKISNVYIVTAYADQSGDADGEPEVRFRFAFSDKQTAKEVLEKGKKTAWRMYWEIDTILLDEKEFAEHMIEQLNYWLPEEDVA